ncbi:tetratricopeptide repeat protein [bacterium]|nr:tetratricopeptide repeat protein [bacterium]RQV95734.1 MAG: hypothetical protein EH221_05835 [bacterium]
MKKQVFIGFIFLAIIILFSCGKEKEEKSVEDLFYPLDESIVKVDVPQVSWEESIAVVPPDDQQDHIQDDPFSILFHAELVSRLSETAEFKIVTPPTEEWIDQENLKVDYILKNKRERDRWMLQLVSTQNDSVLWADYHRTDAESILTVTEQVSANITTLLKGDYDRIYPLEETAATPQITELYLEAKSHLLRGTREEIDLAVEKFKTILRIDTTYTPAYLGLAESYLKITNDLSDPNPVWLRLAQDASLKAVQLDPNLGEGYLRLGQVYLARGDFLHAEQAFRQTVKINANAEEAWIGLGQIYSHFGLYQPCLEVYDRALSLNPADASVLLSRALIHIGFTQYREAEEDIQRLLRIHPEDLFYHSFLGLVLYYQNHFTGALNALRTGVQSDAYRSFSHAVLGMVYAKQGLLDDALAEVELEVKPYVGHDGSLATAVAAVYTLIRQNGQAVQWLEKAVDWGYREYPWLANDPNFIDLHQDERFVTLLTRIKAVWEENMRLYSPEGYTYQNEN